MTRYPPTLLLVVLVAACSPPARAPTPTSLPPVTSTPAVTRSVTLGVWHDLVYHDRLGKVVLVNGGPETGKPSGDPLGLWAWDGEKWSLLAADPDGPHWRNYASVTYDSNRGVLVLYGGLQSESQAFEDTWEWDGKVWSQRADQGPGPREAAGMAYDSAGERVILFGGSQAGQMMNDTWEWDGSAWTQVSDEGPAARFPASFVYDEANQNVMLFGGHAFDSHAITTYGDTWTWDGTAWKEIQSEGPSPRDGADSVFDRESNQVLLFGGAEIGSDVTLLNDTWLWDGSQWNKIEADGPPARVHPAMAYDAARGRVVITGGSNAPSTILSDTWEWDGQAWTCIQGCN